MSKGLTISVGKQMVLYRDMRAAIAKCNAVDECKGIADRSAGLAAYYAQIKDTETEFKFYRIRLRAWRRIGELLSVVDLAGCETQAAKVKKIRDSFKSDIVNEISDSRILEIIKLQTLSDGDFEFALKRITAGGIGSFWQHTPQGIKEFKAAREQQERAVRELEKKKSAHLASPELKTQREAERIEREHEDELFAASEAAMQEVGITLERKDRARMKQVVFLIKEDVHAVMRQAAFDKRVTMQDILRRGLRFWLEANGYDYPDYNEIRAVRRRAIKDAQGVA